MKVAVTAQGSGLDSPVEARFGRARGFILFDTEGEGVEYLENSVSLSSAQGAGIQAAKRVIDSGAKVLIAPNVGPKAFGVLNKSGVEVYACDADAVVKDVLGRFKQGLLTKVGGPNVEGHW